MPIISNFPTGSSSGKNKPIINLTGTIVICELESGVYNIDGSWLMTTDDSSKQTSKDDLFFVYTDETECKLTYVSAGHIRTYCVPISGTASDIIIDDFTTMDEVTGMLNDLASGKVNKIGDTMTGALVAQNNSLYTTKQVRNIFLIADNETLPSGENGDICLVYTP